MQRPFQVGNPGHIRVGANTTFLGGAIITPITNYANIPTNPSIEIGDNVYIGRHLFIGAMDRVSIANGCVLSDYVYLNDSSHGFDPAAGPIMLQPLTSKGPIIIGEECFLGYRSVIMPGVTLGDHCIVGANAVVTKSFPPYSVLGGVPAKLLKVREDSLNLSTNF